VAAEIFAQVDPERSRRRTYGWHFAGALEEIHGKRVMVLIVLLQIPQGLAYAKLADIPVEAGLMSSWLPALIYAIMGTSKGMGSYYLELEK
jgi:hypothetical protein